MPLENGEIADADDVNDLVDTVVNVPIAGAIPFFSHISGSPTLPANFVACDGQTLDNDLSPLDGQVIPNLNGLNSFLRGNSTSGATGGSATHSLSAAENGPHSHTVTGFNDVSGNTEINTSSNGSGSSHAEATSLTGGGAAHNNEPQYMNCVWVMRIY